jgi:hypothetical protein
MKLKRINQKFNTSLQDICKNLNSSLEELIQVYNTEASGWGCFVFNKEGVQEYTFVNGDEENSECMDPEYGISYFMVRSEGAATKLVEVGISQNGKTQNAEGPYRYKLDDRGDFIAYYHYGKYSGTDMAKWLEQVNASRTNGESPTYTDSDGSKAWFVDGKLHREDGPAWEGADGSKAWFVDGKRHRVDGPAIEFANGSKVWYFNGELHNANGPAIEYANGSKQWFLNGKRHRVDGPAVEHADGEKVWYLDGKLHRVDGPAKERADGSKEWYLDGELHNANGPAIEHADGSKQWWLNGKQFTQEEWKAEVSKLNLKVKKLTADETVPPNFTGIAEWADGTKEWYVNGKLHRADGPAIEYADGSKSWWLNGKRHREDGPAWEGFDGRKEWWLNGKQFTQEKWKAEVSKRSNNCAPLTAAVASATIVGSVPTEQNCQTRVEKMSKAETIKTIVMSDGKMVAQRVAVEKIAKVLQGLIVEGITRNSKGKNKTVVKTQLGEFFNTDQGRAAIKFLVGCLAPFVKSHVPEKYHGVIDEIATEARVQGETTAMLNIIDMVQPMIAMLSSTVMDSLQPFVAADEKVRVELDPSTIPVEHQEVVFAAPTKAATV